MSGNVDISSLAIKVSSDGISEATLQLNALTEAATAAEGKSVILSKATQDSVQATTASSSAADKYAQKLLQQSDLLGKNNEYSAKYIATTKGATDAQLTTVSALGKNLDAWRALGEAQRQATLMDQQYNAEAARTANANKAVTDSLALLQVRIKGTRGDLEALKAQQLGADAAVQASAKQVGDAYEHSAEKGEGAMGRLGLGTVGAKRELMVLGHEIMTGNFSRIPGSMLVLAERMEGLGALFALIVNPITIAAAAVGILAIAFIAGGKEVSEFNRQMQLTGGYAGITRGQFNEMALSIANSTQSGIGSAKDTLMGFISTGKFTGETLKQVAITATQFAEATGQSSEEVVKSFESITKGVVKWAETQDEKYHFLTASQFEHISALEKQGKTSDAITETMRALNDRLSDQKIKMGESASAWKIMTQEASAFWDTLKGIGREDTAEEKIAKLKKIMVSGRQNYARDDSGLSMQSAGQAALEKEWAAKDLDFINRNKQFAERMAQIKAENEAVQDAGKKAVTARNTWDAAHQTSSEKEKTLIDADIKQQQDITKAGDIQVDSEEKRARRLAEIHEEAYGKPKTKDTGLENATEAAQMAALNVEMNYQKLRYDAEVNFQNKLYAAGDITEQEKIDRERTAITAKIAAVAESYVKEFDSLEKYNGKDETARKNHEAKVDGIRKKAADDMSSMLGILNNLSLEEDKSSNAAYAASLKEVEALEKQAATLADSVKVRGISKSAIDDEQVALAAKNLQSAEELLNTAKSQEVGKAEIDLIQKRIDLLKREFTARQSIASSDRTKEVAEAAAKQATAYKNAWDASYKSIEDGLYNAISNGGGNAVQKLLKDMKNWFARLVLSPIINPIASFGSSLLNPYANQAAGSVAGALGGSNGGILGNIGSLGSSIYNGFGAASAASSGAFNSFAFSGLGQGLGLSSAGAGIGAGEAGLSSIGALGSSISSFLPYFGAAIASYGLLKSGLSMGEKTLGNQTVTGNLGTDNLTRNVPWTQSGGFLRSDRSGTWNYGLKDSTAIADGVAYKDNASASSDTTMLNVLTDTYTEVKKSTTDFATSLGLDASSIAGRTDAINLTIGATGAETQANITKLFTGIADNIATSVLGSLSDLKLAGESSSTALQRLSTDFTSVNQIFKLLGYSENQVGEAGVRASEAIIKLYGSLADMQTISSSYYTNYYTAAEKTKVSVDAITKSFSDLGLGLPSTREELRKWIDEAKKSGNNELYVSLMKLTPAFTLVSSSMDDLSAKAVSDANTIAAANKKISDENYGLQTKWLTLTGKTTELRKRELDLIDPSNRLLQQQIWNEEDKQTADAKAAADKATADAKAVQDAAAATAAAQQASQAIISAWQSVTDGLFSEVKRIRGLTNGTANSDTLASLQAKFAITNAQALAGDKNAATLLPQISQALLLLAETQAHSSIELALIRAQTANTLENTGTTLSSRYGTTVPAFASGGAHSGGWRVVGEQGAELEYTGASHIFNASDTRNMLSDNSSSQEMMQELVNEIISIRRDNMVADNAIVDKLNKMYKLQNNWDVNGLTVKGDSTLPAVPTHAV